MGQCAIIGLGTFGFNTAVLLAQQGHQVLAIDRNEEIIEDIKNLVTHAVVGDAMDKETLVEFVSPDVDAVILGLGEEWMEATILAIVHLRDMGIKHIIVKSMNELRGKVYKTVGASQVIFPEQETAHRLVRRLTIPSLIDQIPLAPEYSIIELATPDSFVGKSVAELHLRQKYGVTVIAIKDVLKDSMVIMPEPGYILPPDSALIVLGRSSDIDHLKQFR
jgi:trk system potassium uptake protein TrkA